MARRLRTKAGAADYARRKAIVEPVFGQMKSDFAAVHAQRVDLDGVEKKLFGQPGDSPIYVCRPHSVSLSKSVAVSRS